ncbi:MAG: hypothetical protein IPK19_40550 [Chloroflexi bacterium]|nr:hypothetical protein [Chloroflexota bacterium]
MWDVDSGDEIGAFGEENRRFTTVAISPDGRIVAGGGSFRRLKEQGSAHSCCRIR